MPLAHGEGKESDYDRQGTGRIRRGADPGPRGAGTRPQAPRYVHRVDGRARPAPPRAGDRRQLDRRGAGGLLRHHPHHHQQGRVLLGRGQRPRHPDGHPSQGGDLFGRAGAHQAARGRQVRRRRLQDLGRPARRRPFGRQRPVRMAGSRGLSERPHPQADLQPRRAAARAHGRRRHGQDGHEGHLLPRQRDLRDGRVPL